MCYSHTVFISNPFQMKFLKALRFVAMLLVVVGALNWGLVGFFEFDLVNYLLGSYAPADTVVYDIVGVAGVYVILCAIFCCCGCCKGCKCGASCNCGDDCKCGDDCNCGDDCTCGDNCKPKAVVVKKIASKKIVKAKKSRK